MDFVVRPQSKIDPDEIRARSKQAIQDQRRMKVGFLFPNGNDKYMNTFKKKKMCESFINIFGITIWI